MPAHGGLVRGGMLPDASLRQCGCYPQGIVFVCLDVSVCVCAGSGYGGHVRAHVSV